MVLYRRMDRCSALPDPESHRRQSEGEVGGVVPINDFWGSIDIAEALHPQTLLAYAMNGEDLSPDHGAPIRLRIPRQLGYKNLKYIARISVTESLKNIGDGTGSAAPDIGYSWYGGI